MSRRPTEVYATPLLAATGELPVIRRGPRFTATLNPVQAVGSRGIGGSIGEPFTLPPFGDPSPAPSPAPAPGSQLAAVDTCG